MLPKQKEPGKKSESKWKKWFGRPKKTKIAFGNCYAHQRGEPPERDDLEVKSYTRRPEDENDSFRNEPDKGHYNKAEGYHVERTEDIREKNPCREQEMID